MNNLEVKVVNSSSDDFLECLGITPERSEELQKAFAHAEIDHDQYSDMAATVSKLCRHPNELLFLGVKIGKQMAIKSLGRAVIAGIKTDNP